MLSISLVFAVLTLLFILLFFVGLPDLRSCPLPEKPEQLEKGGHRDLIPLLLIVLIYTVLAFYHLGNTDSPQSFVPMSGQAAVLEFPEPQQPYQLVLFPGVGQGEYSIEVSNDAEGWYPVDSFTQDHVAVLKWQFQHLTIAEPWRYLRIACTSGSPWLGELEVRNFAGERLDAVCSISELTDEPQWIPQESTYMNSTYFDEIYHARTAWEHLNRIWPYEISHPPLGKEILALGILLFGMTPFGWRFSGTLAGILMLPVMYLLLRRLFGRGRIPLLGTVLFAAEFMHYAQTRIATIDSYAVLFILLMYYFMLCWLQSGRNRDLALCGIFFGIGAASKWICLYAGAGLAVLWLAHWIIAFFEQRHTRLVREAYLEEGDVYDVYEEEQFLQTEEEKSEKEALGTVFLGNVLFCICFFILIPALIYYFSYVPYGLAENCRPFSAAYTKLVLDNQSFMFSYHAGIVAEHPYSSRWYQWILDIRPILYYLQYYSDGTRVSIASFVNPLICWAGLLSILLIAFLGLFRRNRTALFLTVCWLSGILPWIFISRLTFEYHYFASSVFLIPAICYMFRLLEQRPKAALAMELLFTGLAVLLFALFFPVLNGIAVDNTLGSKLMDWLPSWPI